VRSRLGYLCALGEPRRLFLQPHQNDAHFSARISWAWTRVDLVTQTISWLLVEIGQKDRDTDKH
jgi:hypothetical protein